METVTQIRVPEVSPAEVSRLVDEIDQRGFGYIPNYIHSEDLARMQAFVADAMRKSGNQYVHFNGPDAVGGSGLDDLARSPRFKKLVYDIYERGTGQKAQEQGFYQVLRCLSGNTGQKNSMIYHYDSYVVTALVPVEIPNSGMAGDLLMYPNTRTIRKTYLFSAMDKVILDNPLSQFTLRSVVNSKVFSPVRIKMQPGNLYFFWGYRSVHTNEPCDPDKVRATALFHYFNPHKQAQLNGRK